MYRRRCECIRSTGLGTRKEVPIRSRRHCGRTYHGATTVGAVVRPCALRVGIC